MDKFFDKKDYVYLGQYKTPLIYNWLLQNWADNNSGVRYDLPKLDGRLVVLDGHQYIFRKDWEILENWTQKIVKEKNEKSFNSIFQLMEETTNNMMQAANKLQNSSGLQTETFSDFFKTMNKMEYPWYIVLPMSERLEVIIRNKLHSLNLQENFLQLFLTPHKPTLLMMQKRGIINIKKELLKYKILNKALKLSAVKSLAFLKIQYPEIFKKIEKHILKYQWFGMMHMWGKSFSEQNFFDQLKNISIHDSAKISSKKMELPQELLWLQKQTHILSYWRNHIAEICGVVSYQALDKFNDASKTLGLNYNLASCLSPQEFLNGLQKKAIPAKRILKERQQSYGLVNNKRKIVIITGNGLKQYIDYALEKVSNNQKISGLIANTGKVKGMVKIILSPNEIYKVKKGDIMIA